MAKHVVQFGSSDQRVYELEHTLQTEDLIAQVRSLDSDEILTKDVRIKVVSDGKVEVSFRSRPNHGERFRLTLVG